MTHTQNAGHVCRHKQTPTLGIWEEGDSSDPISPASVLTSVCSTSTPHQGPAAASALPGTVGSRQTPPWPDTWPTVGTQETCAPGNPFLMTQLKCCNWEHGESKHTALQRLTFYCESRQTLYVPGEGIKGQHLKI